jgi:hypothetical protein
MISINFDAIKAPPSAEAVWTRGDRVEVHTNDGKVLGTVERHHVPSGKVLVQPDGFYARARWFPGNLVRSVA